MPGLRSVLLLRGAREVGCRAPTARATHAAGVSWRTPDIYHTAGLEAGDRPLKFDETRDNIAVVTVRRLREQRYLVQLAIRVSSAHYS